jgi:hypothetical protein
MTPQESSALQDFLEQLTQAKGVSKDPEAEALIAQAVARQPDAAYLLTQRAMLVEQALNKAKEQIAQLKSQPQAGGTPGARSFLGSGSDWGRSAGTPSRPAAPDFAQNPMQMQGTARTARPGFLGGGGGSFLGNLAATAAGVAGGAFLFQGIQSLMGDDAGKAESVAQSDTAQAPTAPASLNEDAPADTGSTAFDGDELGNMDPDTGDYGDDSLA